jgi:hypothetical protein
MRCFIVIAMLTTATACIAVERAQAGRVPRAQPPDSALQHTGIAERDDWLRSSIEYSRTRMLRRATIALPGTK